MGHARSGGDGARETSWLFALLLATLIFPLASLLTDATTVAGLRVQQVAYGVATLAWLAAIAAGRTGVRLPLAPILAFALVGRLLLLPAPISDDVYRYTWEGIVRLHGFNPYVLAPDDPLLAHVRPAWWSLINHPNHAAIYPPGAQGLFACWAAVFPNPFAYKLALTACEALAIGMLVAWLRRAGRAPGWVLVYALCPAALRAFAGEGHLDALLLVGLTLLGWRTAGAAEDRADLWWAGVGFGLAVGAKWVALLLCPWLLVWLVWDSRRRTRAWVFFAGGLLSFGLPALFYLDAGAGAWFGPLRYFAENFHSLDFGRQVLLPWVGRSGYRFVALGLLGLCGLLTLRRSLAASQVWLFGVLLLVSPTLHPWYVTWLLPGLCFGVGGGWLVLPLSLGFAFEGDVVRAATGVWQQPGWVAAAVHLPVLAGLLLAVLWRPGNVAGEETANFH